MTEIPIEMGMVLPKKCIKKREVNKFSWKRWGFVLNFIILFRIFPEDGQADINIVMIVAVGSFFAHTLACVTLRENRVSKLNEQEK